MTFSRSYTLIIALLLLVGCHWQEEGGTDSQARDFIVSPISLMSPMHTTAVSDAWPFYKQKTFYPKICVLDAATQEAIVGQSFELVHANEKTSATSDPSGCLTLGKPQQLFYNELAPEQVVTWETTISALQDYRGVETISLGVVPWKNQLLDLRYIQGMSSVPIHRAIDALFGRGEYSPPALFQESRQIYTTNLYLSSITLIPHSHQKNDRTASLKYLLSCEPKFRRLALDGTFVTLPIEYGLFNLELRVFERGRNEKARHPLGIARTENLPLTDGKIAVDLVALELEHRPRPDTTLEFVVRLDPVHSDAGLLPFLGLFRTHRDALDNEISTPIVELSPERFDQIGQIARDSTELDDPQLKIDSVDFVFPNQDHDLSTDLDLNLTRKEVFNLIIKDPKLLWPLESPNDENFREALRAGTRLKVRVAFVGEQGPHQSVPDKELYNRMRLLNTYESEAVVETQGNSNQIVVPVVLAHDFSEQLFLGPFTQIYLEVGPLPDVEYEFSFKPLTIHSLFNRENPPLKILEASNTFDEVVETLLPTASLHLVELPLASNNALYHAIPRGSQKIFKPKPRIVTPPFEQFLRAIQEPGEPKQIQILNLDDKELRWPKEFPDRVKDSSLYRFYLDRSENFLTSRINDAQGDGILQIFARHFCTLYADPSELAKCLANPYPFVEIRMLEFVEEVLSPPRWVGGEKDDVQVRVRTFRESIDTLRILAGTNTSKNTERGHSADIGFKGIAGFFGGNGGFFRGETFRGQNFWATEVARTRDQRDRTEVMLFLPFKRTKDVIRLDLRVKTCLIISQGTPEEEKAPRPEKQTYFVCHTSDKYFDEAWFSLLSMNGGETKNSADLATLDASDKMARLIRGSYRHDKFVKMISSSIKGLPLEKIPDLRQGPNHLVNDIYQGYVSPFLNFVKDGGIFPGISRYRQFPAGK